MSRYFRYSGAVEPSYSSSAPASYRLPAEVYALDGLSPQDVRRGPLITEIKRMMAQGIGEQEIRRQLLHSSGLPKLHPCADPDGNNVCTVSEINLRMIEAKNPGHIGPLRTDWKSLIAVGGGVALLWLFLRKSR